MSWGCGLSCAQSHGGYQSSGRRMDSYARAVSQNKLNTAALNFRHGLGGKRNSPHKWLLLCQPRPLSLTGEEAMVCSESVLRSRDDLVLLQHYCSFVKKQKKNPHKHAGKQPVWGCRHSAKSVRSTNSAGTLFSSCFQTYSLGNPVPTPVGRIRRPFL